MIHIVYLTHGGGKRIITQTYGELVANDGVFIEVKTPFNHTSTVYQPDVLETKIGAKFTSDEMNDIFARHGEKQVL